MLPLLPTEDLLPFGFPTIDMGPQLKVVERTRTATMLCAASGLPDPEISWFKDFLPVEPGSSNGRIKQLRSGETRMEGEGRRKIGVGGRRGTEKKKGWRKRLGVEREGLCVCVCGSVSPGCFCRLVSALCSLSAGDHSV